MKPSEILKLEEGWREEFAKTGVGGWLARRGGLGYKAGIAATGDELAKKQATLRSASEQVLKQKFIANLQLALEKAINAGRVTLPIPESMESYNNFSRILESAMLNEAVSVETYINEYIKTLMAKYLPLDPSDQSALNNIITQFAAQYKGPGQTFPDDLAGKLSDFISSIKSDKAQDDSGGLKTDYAFPKQNAKVEDSKGNDYLFQISDNKWYTTADGITPDTEITNVKAIQTLNKLHRDQQGSSMGLRSGTALPKADVTVTHNNYDYKFVYASKKWFELDDAGATTKEVTAVRGIDYLNKLAGQRKFNYPTKNIPSITSRTSGRKFKFDLNTNDWFEIDATGGTTKITDTDDIRELNQLAASGGI
jgi:hypothetical protein